MAETTRPGLSRRVRGALLPVVACLLAAAAPLEATGEERGQASSGAEPPAAAAGTGGAPEDDRDDDWEDDWDDGWEEEETSPWHGFVEGAAGTRIYSEDAVGRRATLGEVRWRIERVWDLESTRIDFRGDLLGDAVLEDFEAQLRELTVFWRLGSADLRVGRQIMTWGTGDLLFLNDLFPKGWESFFIGRDNEYLKAPSDAVRLTWYTDAVNLDLVAMPLFNPDEYLTGERLSFFWPPAGEVIAPEPPLRGDEPSASLDNTEWAARLFRNVGGNELAVYGFSGFYHQPSPAGANFGLVFPRLDALGASWRRTLGPGLFNAEFSRYYSQDDRDGTNPFVPNDQYRFLLGYEWEAVTNLTVGFQAYLEWTLDHDELLANSPWPQFEVEERRTWLTNRLTWRTRQDRVIWSLFTFYSPTDDDAYLRPQVSWRINDAWQFSAGGNWFTGDERFTFFAQFEDNSNVYARLRFNY